MNRSETAQVLSMIAAFDRRTIGEADVLAWHQILGDLAAEDCMRAVARHFRDSRDWCMPSDIYSRVEDMHTDPHDEWMREA